MDQLLEQTERIAREAGEIILATHAGEIEFKGEIDLVTRADKASEEHVVRRLTELLPQADVLAEEGSGRDTQAELRWVVDPLDGTTNFAHGYPVFSVSIALERAGSPILGVVYDPSRRECFSAAKDGGARLNGELVRVSGETRLDRSLLATGFPYDVRTHPRDNLTQIGVLAKRARGIRRGGSAALDLAYVACGRFDGFWEEKLARWDMAAGILLVEEAGGTVTDYFGRPVDPDQGHVVASTPGIHGDLSAPLRDIEASAVLPPLSPRKLD